MAATPYAGCYLAHDLHWHFGLQRFFVGYHSIGIGGNLE